jgi:hypothetical protein
MLFKVYYTLVVLLNCSFYCTLILCKEINYLCEAAGEFAEIYMNAKFSSALISGKFTSQS